MDSLKNFFDLLVHSEQLIRVGGLALLLFIVYLETGIFLGFIFAGDALLFSAGLLCGTKLLDVNLFVLLFTVTGAAIAGNITGYYTGKLLGKKLFTKKDTFFFKKKHLEKTRLYYQKYGGMSLIAGRFVWIVRTFVPILAGATDMPPGKFNLYNISGAFLWVWSMIPIGFLAGKLIPNSAKHLEYFILGITFIAMAFLLRGMYKVYRQHKSHPGENS